MKTNVYTLMTCVLISLMLNGCDGEKGEKDAWGESEYTLQWNGSSWQYMPNPLYNPILNNVKPKYGSTAYDPFVNATMTKLMIATKESDVNKVKYLLDEGEDANTTIAGDLTVLDYAIHLKRHDIVVLLMREGAN
jgi:hypothetical protein